MKLIDQYLEELQSNPLNTSFEVRPSPIHGHGIFSQNHIKKGNFINTHMDPGTNITKFGSYLNHTKKPNASSIKNKDGSVDLYFGPDSPPSGMENNYIRTNKGDGFFVYFRLYGPTEPYFEKIWPLSDLEKLNK